MIIISTHQINTGTIEITHKERDIYFYGYYLNSRQFKYWKTRSVLCNGTLYNSYIVTR